MPSALNRFFSEFWPIHMSFSTELMLAELMFLAAQPKRDHFALRIGFGLFFYCLLCWTLPFYSNGWYILFRVVLMFGLSVVVLLFSIDQPPRFSLFVALVSYAIQNLAFNGGNLAISLFRLEDSTLLSDAVALVIFAVTYFLSYFLVVRRFNRNSAVYVNNLTCFVLAIATVVATCCRSLLRSLGILTDNELVIIFNIFCVVLVLSMQFSSLRRGNIAQEKYILEELLRAEERRSAMRQESIDIINMKCHDLRYHLEEFRRANADNCHAQFFAEVAESIDIYDNMPDTGNSALNALLAEKLLYCNAHDISVSYIVDSSVIEIMSASDIYSLFGNAMDNAIHCLEKEDAEKRVISISVQKTRGVGQILIANYCSREPLMENGLPVSEQEDRTHHGFGVRSIEYITHKYDGNMLIDFKDHIFTLSILLPDDNY